MGWVGGFSHRPGPRPLPRPSFVGALPRGGETRPFLVRAGIWEGKIGNLKALPRGGEGRSD